MAQISPGERDKLILELHRRGISIRRIARHVGLSSSGVHKIIMAAEGRLVDDDDIYG